MHLKVPLLSLLCYSVCYELGKKLEGRREAMIPLFAEKSEYAKNTKKCDLTLRDLARSAGKVQPFLPEESYWICTLMRYGAHTVL